MDLQCLVETLNLYVAYKFVLDVFSVIVRIRVWWLVDRILVFGTIWFLVVRNDYKTVTGFDFLELFVTR